MTAGTDIPRPSTAGVALLVMAALWGLAWCRPLMLPDEGRYVGVAWEMLRSGDWLTPTLNGLPYFHKPPLFYWLTAACVGVFGPVEWAARAAPVIGASTGAMSLFLLTRFWVGERASRRLLVVLLAQPLFFIGGQFASLDMLVAGLITATIASLAHAALRFEQGAPYRRWLVAAYAAAALGVLAKGLIGVVLPGAVVVAWLLLRRRWRTLLALLSPLGMAAFLAVAAPWFIAMQQRFPDFLHYFFVVQHFQRFAGSGFNAVQPFWFYPAVLLLAFLPWLPWWRSTLVTAPREATDAAALRGLMWVWVVVITLFFSLPQSKLVGYILPAVPPMAWLLAVAFTNEESTAARPRGRVWRAAQAAGALISLGAIAAASLYPTKSHRELAGALRERLQTGEPVVFIDSYPFDLPFYARLTAPVVVIEDWDDPRVRRVDNWRKELADAVDFAPETGSRLLRGPGSLQALLCSARTVWLVGPTSAAERHPALKDAEALTTVRRATLWRWDRGSVSAAVRCAGTPNAD